MAIVTKFIDVVVTSMDYDEEMESWEAKGHVLMKSTGKKLSWTASHKGNLVVKLDDDWSLYPEKTQQEIRDLIRSTLGRINLPYCHTYPIKI